MADHAVLLPHETFAYLARWPGEFEKRALGGSRRACADYWAGCVTEPWYEAHPARPKVEDETLTVAPLRLYGDDARFQRDSSALILTWSNVTCRLPAWLSRFLITVVPLNFIVDVTLHELYKVVAWSFRVLLENVWPETDHNGNLWPRGSWRHSRRGTPLVPGVCGALAQVLGDWKWLKQAFLLKHTYATRACCHECLAVKRGDGPSFADFAADAEHRATTREHADYMESFQRPPALTGIPGWHLRMIMPDPMHTLHLGVCQWAVGSVMITLCELGLWGRFGHGDKVSKLNAQLRCAYTEFRGWCRRNNVRCSQPEFTAASMNRGDTPHTFPEFKAKAMNTRWVTAWLAEVTCNYDASSTEAILMWGLADLLFVMHGARNPRLSPADARRLERAGRVALLAYGDLARSAAERALPLYCIKPKHHQLDHMLHRTLQTNCNPRYAWAFCDEDFNGRVVRLMRLGQPRHVALRAVRQYALRLYLSLKDASGARDRRTVSGR
ncbi:MAG: hypothetical protein GY772_00030 [bacterium]|nr:hypothetical protein [bacterium]